MITTGMGGGASTGGAFINPSGGLTNFGSPVDAPNTPFGPGASYGSPMHGIGNTLAQGNPAGSQFGNGASYGSPMLPIGGGQMFPGQVPPPQAGYMPGVSATPSGAPTQGGGLEQGILPNLQQLLGFAPQPYQAFGNVPFINPSTYGASQTGAAQVNQSQLPGAMQGFMGLLQSQMDPLFERQNQGLNEQMAQRGLFNSGANIQAQNDLARQQGSVMGGALQPFVSQFADFYNQANQANAGYQQQAGLANMEARNQANQFNANASNAANAANAGAYGNITNENMNQYNAFINEMLTQGMGVSNSYLSSLLGSYMPNNNASGILAASVGANPYASVYGSALQGAGNVGSAISNAFSGLGRQQSGFQPYYGPDPATSSVDVPFSGPGG